jgi:uncharacterized membrane protein
LTFVALVISIITHLRYRSENRAGAGRVFSLLDLVLTPLASVFASLSFLMGIVVDAKARDTANKSDGSVSIQYGSAVWLALVAAILLWFANMASCCGVLRSRRRRAAEKY